MSDMTVDQPLKELRDLLDHPNGWCKSNFAKNSDGESVDPQHPTACKWCLMGGVTHVAGHNELLYSCVMSHLYDALRAIGTNVSMMTFNDAPETTHADVIAVIDKAIENLEGTK